MDSTASLTRDSDGTWTLQSNLPMTVTFPWQVERIGPGDAKQRHEPAKAITVSAEELVARGGVRFRQIGAEAMKASE